MKEATPLGSSDYPVAENCPERLRSRTGKSLHQLTVRTIVNGEAEMEDFRITRDALRRQAEIARDVGRAALADNLERAAEMAELPQALVLETYELLRPGRCQGPEPLLAAARHLREQYGAERLAAFIEDAAQVYARRGLFSFRY